VKAALCVLRIFSIPISPEIL